MSRNSEFLKYMEFTYTIKKLEKLIAVSNQTNNEDDISKTISASTSLMDLRKSTKRTLGYNEQSFKLWLKANEEFIKILTKQERSKLKNAYNKFSLSLSVEDLNDLLILLNNVNYSEFIEQYIEDYEI